MKIKTYLMETFDGMTKGLFASLIIGLIIKQVGDLSGIQILTNIGQTAQYMMGPCIGAGIAIRRKAGIFATLAAMAAGAIGAGTIRIIDPSAVPVAFRVAAGEPVGSFIAALVGVEVGKLAEGKTKFDLLVVPAAVIVCGGVVGVYLSPVMSAFMAQIGRLINEFTLMQPVPMGILLGTVVGIILTSPISSAATCIAVGIDGLAAGAALAGCCAQMVGFAAISYRENKMPGLLAQGLGTSMIQMPNIIKNPWLWLPPTIASAACGLLAATVFKMETNSVGAGMGTSGLVGQIQTLSVMGVSSIVPMLILHIIIPAALSLAISEFMRKKNVIKFGDLKL